MIGYFSHFCEEHDIKLENVNRKVVDAYLDHLNASRHSKKGGPLSSHTVFLHVTRIKIFLNYCAQDEDFEKYVKTTTVRKISKPKREELTLDTFTKEQVHALISACEKVDVGSEKLNSYLINRDRAMIYLLLDTGIRAAELCGLTMRHLILSPNDPHIRVFGKGDKWREIGLGKKCREELERFVNQYRANEKGTDAFVFLTRKGGPMNVRTLQNTTERIGRLAHIENVRCSPHTYRHSYAVTFMRQTGNIYKLSKLMGHSSVKITENYLKSFTQQDARRGAISPVDEV